MGKHKSGGKDKGKDSQLLIRIDKAEREAFVSICERMDTSAAREIRRFMREFVATHGSADAGHGAASETVETAAEPQPAPVAEAAPDAPSETAPEAKASAKPRKSRDRAAAH